MASAPAVPQEGGARGRLSDALIALTKEKSLSSISITELCNAAGVSRMAFYRNFQSKEDVLISRLEDLVEHYRGLVEPLFLAGERWYGIGHLTVCFSFFREHADFVESLHRCGFWDNLVNRITKYLVDCWGNGTRESKYVLSAFAGSLCAAYHPWAEGGFAETPRQMAELLGSFYTGFPSTAEG